MAILIALFFSRPDRSNAQTEFQSLDWSSPTTNVILRPGNPFPLKASASSGLPVDFRVEFGPARIEGTTIVTTNWGPVGIIARQGGDSVFYPRTELRVFNRYAVHATRVGRWPGVARGPISHAVAVSNDRAYACIRDTIVLFDIANSDAIRRLGEIQLDGWIHDIATEGSLVLAVGAGFGLSVIDAADPNQPRELGRCWIPGEPSCIAVDGQLALVGDVEGAVHAIRFQEPSAPVRIGGLGGLKELRSVAIEGTRAYVAGAQLHCLELSDPARPKRLGGLEIGGIVFSKVLAAGKRAVVSGSQGPLWAVDVSNPREPMVLGGNDQTVSTDFAVVGQHIWSISLNGGLRILDLGLPDRLPEIGGGTLNSVEYAYAIATDGRRVVVGSHRGLTVLDAQRDPPTTALGSITTSQFSSDLDLVGSNAYLAEGPDGLVALNVSNPGTPQARWHWRSQGHASKVTASASEVYLADGTAGLKIFDVNASDPPTPIGSVQAEEALTRGVHDVAVTNGLAFITGSRGVQSVDVRDPRSPRLMGRFDLSGSHFRVAARNRQALVYSTAPGSNSGLRVIDFSDPMQPVASTTFFEWHSINDVRVAGDFALVSMTLGFQSHLVALNLQDQPWTLLRIPGEFPNQPRPVHLSAEYAFAGWTTFHPSLGVAKVSMPETIEDWGTVSLLGHAQAIRSAGDLVYVAEGEHGLNVYRLEYGIHPQIQFDLPATMEIKDPPHREHIPLHGESNSGAVVSYRVVSGPAFVEGGQLVVTNSGMIRVRAEVSGAPPLVPISLERIIVASKRTQVIENYYVGTTLLGGPPVMLNPSSTSGLPVTMEVWSGPGVLRGNLLHVTNTGTVRLFLAQEGNSEYLPAYGSTEILVKDPPVILREPQPMNGAVGTPLALEIEASGEPPLRIQWFRDGQPLPGATQPSLKFPNASPADQGLFHAVVTSPSGVVTSSIVSLTVDRPGSEIALKRRGSAALEQTWGSPGVAKIEVSDSFAFITQTTHAEIQIFDCRDPDRPIPRGRVRFAGRVHADSALSDGILYLAEGDQGLGIVDVRDPLRPTRLGTFRLPPSSSEISSVTVRQGIAFLGNGRHGLFVMDVRNPTKPKFLGLLTGSRPVARLELVGDRLYSADQESGFRIINVAEAARPTLTTTYPSAGAYDGRALDLIIRGSVLHVADASRGFRTFDLADPGAIRLTHQAPGNLTGLDAAGRWVFAADRGRTGPRTTGGVRLWDVSDPLKPADMGRLSEWGSMTDVRVVAGQLWVVGSHLGILDIAAGGTPPRLVADVVGTGIRLSWADEGGELVLESGEGPLQKAAWEAYSETQVEPGGRRSILVQPAHASRFFRLRKP